jgi:hypothetical protein
MQNRSRQRCAACGAEAPASSRFCGQCGQPLAPPVEAIAHPEGQPAVEEAPIFLHTSPRSYQVKGEAFTLPPSSKTRPLPLEWLEETLHSEPLPRPTKTRPFPYLVEEQDGEPAQPPGRSPLPFPLALRLQGQAPLSPPLPRTPPAPARATSGDVSAWLSSVVADLEGRKQPPKGRHAWKKRTLLIALFSVAVVTAIGAFAVLLSSRGL